MVTGPAEDEDVDPSPKSQSHPTIPVPVLVKVTGLPQTIAGPAVKLTVGGGETVTVCVAVAVAAPLLTVRVMV
jgi:hypothetical protein